MRTLKWMLLMVISFSLPTLSNASSLGKMHISLIEGDVQIQTEETGDWVSASINMPLKEGDRIWVARGGRLELRLRDGTAIRLDEGTALDILTLERDDYQFYLGEGRIYVNFKGSRGSILQIETPRSSTRAYDRTIFRMERLDDNLTEISVYFGTIHVETEEGRIRVDPDRTLSLREGLPPDLGPMGPPDEWERWNRSRDRRYAERRGTSRYLPEELHPYAHDFEEHGRWVFVREYGYVWTPTVVVSAGWAPYRIGRWIWIRGDYVWISYEPWGWVPYHYGRWVFVPPFGWCWVPPLRGGVFWGPGFVAWVYTPSYVCWVPLAPGEIYYGYGYFGPHSVNLLNVNITTLNVQKVVYKNVHVHNAVTIVHRDTFLYGKKVEVKVRENPFLREKIHIGRPEIKPERPTVMPVIREIHEERRPPKRIDEIRPEEIKRRRPLTREREVSVMRPESPPKEMDVRPKEIRPFERREDRIEDRPRVREVEKRRGWSSPKREIDRPTDPRPSEKQEGPVEKGPSPSSPGLERQGEDRRPIEAGNERLREKPAPEPKKEGIEERSRSGRSLDRPQSPRDVPRERRETKSERAGPRGEGEGQGGTRDTGATLEKPSYERGRRP